MKTAEMGEDEMDRPFSCQMLPVTILAGGRSRRMGEDKALIDFQGQPLIRRVIDLSSSISGKVSVVVHRDRLTSDRYRLLAAETGIELIPDDYDHQGPLGGMATAIRHHSHQPAILVLPCDMPFLTERLLRRLVICYTETTAEATILSDKDGFR
ncbi:MAG: molybdenum cofactor guanylyltransferase, partial [Acidobacteriota bacterium]